MKALIMAGGGGTRLWPVSRHRRPKQILPFTDNETLLQKTYARVAKIFTPADIFISTGADQVKIILEQLPEFSPANLITEPCRRNTAAAIGLSAITIAKRFPNEDMMTFNSDHFIKNEEEYQKTVRATQKLLSDHPAQAVMVGVRPNYPDTGLGYIKLGEKFSTIDGQNIYRAEKFVEKPDADTAAQYVTSGEYLWNPAMFAWNLANLEKLFAQHLPDLYAGLVKIKSAIGTSSEQNVLNCEFPQLPAISIDYGIMEKLTDMLVVESNFVWADIGNWRTIKDVLSTQSTDNVVKGNSFQIDSAGNLIYSYTNKLIATLGIKDSIIVDTEDVLLICPKNQAQDVRKIVEKLEKEGKTEYL